MTRSLRDRPTSLWLNWAGGPRCLEWSRQTPFYPSDLSDEQWALIEPHLSVYPGGQREQGLDPAADLLDGGTYICLVGQVPSADEGSATKDRQRSVRSSGPMIQLAMIQLMPNRLRPKPDQSEFHYQKAA